MPRNKTAIHISSALLLTFGSATGAFASHRHHRHHKHAPSAPTVIKIDQSPVSVQTYALPDTTDPARANFLRKMHLENGVEVRSTRWITKPEVTTRNLFILDITQSLEGGFDSVNMYDRGVLSWGVMQWTAHTGSLAHSLLFIKRRLWATKRKVIWDKMFVAYGLDVDPEGISVYGKRVTDPDSARLVFRGSTIPGNYDPVLVTRWATIFARAGRQPEIQELQEEYAGHIVDSVLQKRLALPYHAPGRDGMTTADLTANDPYAEALVFALWTNNPRHAFEYIHDAAKAARSVSQGDDPTLWAPGAFSAALLRRCQSSRFGNWKQRAALIQTRAQIVRSAAPSALTPFERDYQGVLAARKAKRALEIASRHMPPPGRKKAAVRTGVPKPVEEESRAR